MSIVSLGVSGFGHAMGERTRVEEVVSRYTENVEKVKGWGYEHFYLAPSDVGITDLAVQAAEAALESAGLHAEEIDFIVLAVTDMPEYLYWDQGCEFQRRIGAKRAQVLVVNHACASGMMAYELVAGQFAIHPNYQHALVVATNRICEEYRNRTTYNTSLHSDGAAAHVVKRDHPECRWLVTNTLTDGTYSKLFRVEWGGAAQPFNAENLQLLHTVAPVEKVQEFFEGDYTKLLEFIQLLNQRNRLVVEQACEQAGIQLSDLSRVLYIHDNQKAMNDVATVFGISLEKTNAVQSAQYGHMGAADQLLDMQLLIESGELQRGDYVAILGIGVGIRWSCALFQV